MSEFGLLQKHEKTQHALYNSSEWGSDTLLQLPLLGESDPNFPTGKKIPWVQRGVKKRRRKREPFHASP